MKLSPPTVLLLPYIEVIPSCSITIALQWSYPLPQYSKIIALQRHYLSSTIWSGYPKANFSPYNKVIPLPHINTITL